MCGGDGVRLESDGNCGSAKVEKLEVAVGCGQGWNQLGLGWRW